MLSIPVLRAPDDVEALASLHREVWSCIQEVISFTTEQEANSEIVSYYLAFQASDGFADGDWYATSSALNYTFGDAAGLCVCEMYAVSHWARLAMLDYWPDLRLIAESHGAVIAPAGVVIPEPADGKPTSGTFDEMAQREMHTELTGRSDRVFFIHDGRLAYAESSESAGDDHEIRLYGDERTTVGRLPAAERDRVIELVRSGRCACESCQRLRGRRGLPLAPEPADAPPGA